jgi:hypothetical protein
MAGVSYALDIKGIGLTGAGSALPVKDFPNGQIQVAKISGYDGVFDIEGTVDGTHWGKVQTGAQAVASGFIAVSYFNAIRTLVTGAATVGSAVVTYGGVDSRTT